MSLLINEVQPLHLFSEIQHYVAVSVEQDLVKVKRLGSNDVIDLSPDYVSTFLKTADQYTTTVKVGKEDKYWTAKQIADAIDKKEFTNDNAPAVGDVRVRGIRTIFEEIHSTQVFTIAYLKQGKAKSKRQITAEREAQAAELVAELERVKLAKKGVTEAAKKAITKIQENPVVEYIDGEERILRGYKVQFTSRDGKYNCVDIDLIPKDGIEKSVRPVNINTITWLVFDGTKYEVE